MQGFAFITEKILLYTVTDLIADLAFLQYAWRNIYQFILLVDQHDNIAYAYS